ncbi:hypothetical protein JF634_11425 [Simonsiella muelleri]|uniref:Uncharacterized protein n=1 Tax=Simonsiella muelleri ATCC 29453 TaxID=641147 RepID=V9H7D4_9NEIS|nr:hypothetical protein [Simonsiella muelleri]AUX61676.1 hypothetical protein BWP33_07590 [Simonsiella muelleri ATCC 29453]EFG29916.1 hypothetical protein HMPREF9021_02235 [Simonsiella muelleri ATCC 29453]UBQ53747.1 hypothetical protein JF634_11425 [Simonsiella muelleri]
MAMTAFEKMVTGQRKANIRKGGASKAGNKSRRLSNNDLINKAKSGKATTYEAHLLSRRKSMGGKGG